MGYRVRRKKRKQGKTTAVPAQIQPQLEIGAPGDKYEQQADAVADKVMMMPNNTDEVQMQPLSSSMDISMKCAECDEEEGIQRQVEEEEEKIQMKAEDEEEKVQMKEEEEDEVQMKPALQKSGDGQMHTSPSLTTKVKNTEGQGSTLPEDVGTEMGSKIGADFGNVKIHTDSNAVQMNEELGAQAFTHGNDIYFNQGKYAPESSQGKHLLAHELTHVVQQTGSNGIKRDFIDEDHHSPKENDLRSAVFRGDPGIRKIHLGQKNVSKWKNNREKEVFKIQDVLINLGYELPLFGADGVFGSETERAIKDFQRDFGLGLVDGIVGPITIEYLDDIQFGQENKESKDIDDDFILVQHFDEEENGAPLGTKGSKVRQEFEKAVENKNWNRAYLLINGLNMTEMLDSLDDLGVQKHNEFWDNRRTTVINSSGKTIPINLPRIEYARNVVLQGVLPDVAPGDLEATGQVNTAANFIAERLLTVASTVNPAAISHLQLILLECNRHGISDRSHIAYVMATAHHESKMGARMTEVCVNKCIAYEKSPKKEELGNTSKGDGSWFRGRGYAQLTGRRGYKRYSKVLGIDLVGTGNIKNPNQAAEPKNAAKIIAHGMKNGTFTGVKLSDFGSDGKYKFVSARKIINALNEADNIAKIARNYRKAMNPGNVNTP